MLLSVFHFLLILSVHGPTNNSIMPATKSSISFPSHSDLLLCTCYFTIIQFRLSGNSLFFRPISHLLGIRDGRAFRCKLRLVHR